MIQKRVTIVTSAQPRSSKWCWSGAILNMRLPVSLNDPTCKITETVIMTKRPPKIAAKISVRVRIEIPASAPPSASEPVSRSDEHTSELQSRGHLVCRLLLEKKNRGAQLLAMEVLLASCGGGSKITIGAQTYTERKLMAYRYKELIEEQQDGKV